MSSELLWQLEFYFNPMSRNSVLQLELKKLAVLEYVPEHFMGELTEL